MVETTHIKDNSAPANGLSTGSQAKNTVLGNEVIRAAIALIIAFAVISVSVSTHLLNPLLAIATAFCLSIALTNWLPGIGLITVFVAAIFQNTFVALVSPEITSQTSFSIIRGYNFIILSAAWAVAVGTYLFRLRGENPALDRIMKITLTLFAVITFYFALGVLSNPLGAAIYLRSIATGVMFFQLCVILFAISKPKPTIALMMIVFLLLVTGYMELFFRDQWNALINGLDFWELSSKSERESLAWDKQAAERGIVTLSVFDNFSVVLFNTPLLSSLKIQITRLLGPNMHPISYAYLITFFIMFCAFRGHLLTAALLVPLVIFANAKGAIILLILVSSGWLAARIFGTKFAVLALGAVLGLYILGGIVVGLYIGDYHVLGFMGGVYNFFENPFGRGIGLGGNLSVNFANLNWPEYQAAGRTPIAIESAIGVLMYQMGLGAFIYIGVCIWIAGKTIMIGRQSGHSLHIAAGFALLAILANGIFQEEALFSPLAYGLIMALNGMIIGSAIRHDDFKGLIKA